MYFEIGINLPLVLQFCISERLNFEGLIESTDHIGVRRVHYHIEYFFYGCNWCRLNDLLVHRNLKESID